MKKKSFSKLSDSWLLAVAVGLFACKGKVESDHRSGGSSGSKLEETAGDPSGFSGTTQAAQPDSASVVTLNGSEVAIKSETFDKPINVTLEEIRPEEFGVAGILPLNDPLYMKITEEGAEVDSSELQENLVVTLSVQDIAPNANLSVIIVSKDIHGQERIEVVAVADLDIIYDSNSAKISMPTRYTNAKFAVVSTTPDLSESFAAYVMPPEEILLLNATVVSSSAIQLSWEPGDEVSSFVIAYRNSKAPKTCKDGTIIGPDKISGKKHTVTGLKSGKKYGFRVCALNAKEDPEYTKGKTDEAKTAAETYADDDSDDSDEYQANTIVSHKAAQTLSLISLQHFFPAGGEAEKFSASFSNNTDSMSWFDEIDVTTRSAVWGSEAYSYQIAGNVFTGWIPISKSFGDDPAPYGDLTIDVSIQGSSAWDFPSVASVQVKDFDVFGSEQIGMITEGHSVFWSGQQAALHAGLTVGMFPTVVD